MRLEVIPLRTFFPIPYFENFEIDVFGNVRDVKHHNGIDVPDNESIQLLAQAFIGPAPYRAICKRPSIESRNITYIVESYEELNDGVLRINGDLFRPIDGFSRYRISDVGVIWSCVRTAFVHASYNYAGYMTATITDDSDFRSPRKVHRLVYMAFRGPIPNGFEVDHRDDFRTHNHETNLQLLTPKDNARKAFASINNPHENYWTLEEIHMICAMLERNLPLREIATAVGRDYDSIRIAFNHLTHRLRNGVSYADIASQYDLSDYCSAVNKKSSVLNPDDIRQIRQRLENGERLTNIAASYGCSTSTISKIRDHKTWKTIGK